MTATARLISPIDGTLIAERDYASVAEVHAALAHAKAAQRAWQDVSIAERAELCSRIVDAMVAMTAEIVPELALQMGRPVRYGAGEVRGFEERARHMIRIASTALAPIEIVEKANFKRTAQFTDHKSGDDDTQRGICRRLDITSFTQIHKQSQVFFPNILHHEGMEGRRCF